MSLEAVARRAGVGSATLHRHFPSRKALLQAIFADDVEQLRAHAAALRVDAANPMIALEQWLSAFTTTIAGSRGMAAVFEAVDGDQTGGESDCHAVITDVVSGLLNDARASGGIRGDVVVDDILVLATAIGATPDPTRRARLLEITTGGLLPTREAGVVRRASASC